jgi:hypothetical protein
MVIPSINVANDVATFLLVIGSIDKRLISTFNKYDTSSIISLPKLLKYAFKTL